MFRKIIAVAILSLGFISAAWADGMAAQKEASTAAMHAGFSSKSKDVAGVRLHLHHVINCLVGEKGDGFDPKAGDPCQGMGNGAINDASGSFKAELEKALAEAKAGLSTDELAEGQADAGKVEQILNGALGK